MVAENEVAEETIGKEVRNSLDGGRGRRPLGTKRVVVSRVFASCTPHSVKFRL